MKKNLVLRLINSYQKAKKQTEAKKIKKLAEKQTQVKKVLKDAAQKLTSALQNRILTHVQLEANKPAHDAVMKIRSYNQSQLSDWNSSKQKVMAHIQPEGTRFVKVGLDRTAFVIEQKPTLRTLRFDDRLLSRLSKVEGESAAGGEYVHRQVSLPYVIFIFEIANNSDGYSLVSLKTFFRNEPLRSTKDQLFHSVLPNMSSDSVCLGSAPARLYSSPVEVVENTLAFYWGAGFTMDYLNNWRALANDDSRFKTAETWSAESKADPVFSSGVHWQLYGVLEDWIKQFSFDGVPQDDMEFVNKTVGEFEEEISKLIATAANLDSETAKILLTTVESSLLQLAD